MNSYRKTAIIAGVLYIAGTVAGIINQSDLPEKTGLAKANVSRPLDLLESRGLVDKRGAVWGMLCF